MSDQQNQSDKVTNTLEGNLESGIHQAAPNSIERADVLALEASLKEMISILKTQGPFGIINKLYTDVRQERENDFLSLISKLGYSVKGRPFLPITTPVEEWNQLEVDNFTVLKILEFIAKASKVVPGRIVNVAFPDQDFLDVLKTKLSPEQYQDLVLSCTFVLIEEYLHVLQECHGDAPISQTLRNTPENYFNEFDVIHFFKEQKAPIEGTTYIENHRYWYGDERTRFEKMKDRISNLRRR